MKTIKILFILLFATTISSQSNAQDNRSIVQNFLNQNKDQQGWSDADISGWTITNAYYSNSTKTNHVYIKQVVDGIEIADGLANFNIRDGKVFSYGDRLIKNIGQKVSSSSPSLSPIQAIEQAAQQLGLTTFSNPKLVDPVSIHNYVYDKAGVSLENIPVKLVYQSVEDGSLRIAWDLSINTLDAQDWWSVRVDGITGEIISKDNWTSKCDFGNCSHSNNVTHESRKFSFAEAAEENVQPPVAGSYNVFAIPVESPAHGPRSIVTDPEDPIASPFGWHDDDGEEGAEYDFTRGNNVHAYEDLGDNNNAGDVAEGGAGLSFDFPYNPNDAPINNLDACITNLFYMNNIMHDVWYHYGFDEPSGNFQEEHYSDFGGIAGDYVRAEAQDGSGEDNANFSTPQDGQRPRMQMYVWTPSHGNYFFVNSPPSAEELDIVYATTTAEFGPPIPLEPLTRQLALATDETEPDPYDICEPIENEDDMIEKIVVINRGTCFFVDKVRDAEDQGAEGVVIVNNIPGSPVPMGGDAIDIDIPSVMISQEQGAALIAALENGDFIEGTLHNATGSIIQTDSDFDNGIIAHEYGHGISTRLTGGAGNSGCLGNDEQMGEGWSDWFGIMLTMNEGDVASQPRGVGTYVTGQSIDGTGIRPRPYSTDFAINEFTYDYTNDADLTSLPHGIGFVWASMLWDLNWALIDQYGYDSDVYNGTGGNNIAMQLVIDGLKLQPCSPGFVDGRDAILEADMLNYDGAHQCLIWQVFANRGLGASADQGSPNSRTDQVEAFDVPEVMSETDYSFCEGGSVTINGTVYTEPGTYTDVLQAALGCDSLVISNVTIGAANTNIIQDVNTLIADNSTPGVTYQWINCADSQPIEGETNQEFIPGATGEYAISVTEGDCTGTSDCFDFFIVGVEELIAEQIKISPNPTSDNILVDFGSLRDIENLSIMDASGRLLFSQSNVSDRQVIIEMDKYRSGVYFFSISTANGTSVHKIIKR